MQISITLAKQLKNLPSTDKLGFGQYFTDHMLVADYLRGVGQDGWSPPEILPYSNFSLDPGASALHYGQALFEGMKAFKQVDGKVVLFRPEFNARRMQMGAERLCMQAPSTELFVEGICRLVDVDSRWIPEGVGNSLYIRPTLIGTEAFLGVRPSNQYRFFVLLSPVGAYYSVGSGGVKIFIETQDLRAAPGGLGATKAAANYAASLRAATRAKEKGYSQVLWLDSQRQHVEEVGTMNIFFRVGDEVWTPRLNGSILEGGTRNCVITLLKEWGITVVEKEISLSELRSAHRSGKLLESFGTGTAAVITKVDQIDSLEDQWKFLHGSDSISDRLYREITSIQYGIAEDKYGWCRIVKS